MNLFLIIILAALVIEYVLHTSADLLNLRALKYDLPSGLEGIYKPEEYRKSQQYSQVNIRLDIFSATFRLAVMLAFWFAGGFNFLYLLVNGWGFGPIIGGLIYIGILAAAYTILSLPLNIYETFVVEARFGFNKSTPGTFVSDMMKSLGLVVVLGGALLLIVLALFQYAGLYAALYCWAAVNAFSFGVQIIAPAWIMPLFNKFTPLGPGELRDAIMGYTKSVSFPVKNVYVIDSSKRTTKSNAFFTGFGRNKRIALFDTLIANHTVAELVGVLAHEVGHYKKKHVLQQTLIGIAHSAFLFALLSIFIRSPGLYQAFYIKDMPVYAGLLFFGLLYTPIELLLGIGLQALSRKHEFEADRFAAETTSQPQAMVEALKKLHAKNLSNLSPHPFYVFLNYSHPTLEQRIKAIQSVKK
jgi:STE24 endopeptidase